MNVSATLDKLRIVLLLVLPPRVKNTCVWTRVWGRKEGKKKGKERKNGSPRAKVDWNLDGLGARKIIDAGSIGIFVEIRENTKFSFWNLTVLVEITFALSFLFFEERIYFCFNFLFFETWKFFLFSVNRSVIMFSVHRVANWDFVFLRTFIEKNFIFLNNISNCMESFLKQLKLNTFFNLNYFI